MANLQLLLQAPFLLCLIGDFCTFWCRSVSFGTRAGTKILFLFQVFNLIVFYLASSLFFFGRKLHF